MGDRRRCSEFWQDADLGERHVSVELNGKEGRPRRSGGWRQKAADRRFALLQALEAERNGQSPSSALPGESLDMARDNAGEPIAERLADAGAKFGAAGPVNGAALRGLRDAGLSVDELVLARSEWVNFARIEQYQLERRPETWLVMGGRGAGKTRVGAEWVNSLVRGLPPFSYGMKHGRLALVGETLGDVREVMIDGPSGIRTISRHDPPHFEAGRRRLLWPSGAIAQIFSSEDPDSLRGPQFDAAWCDELAKWKHAEACFDMLQFGLRLGEQPRQLITTTPRPLPLLKRLLADPTVHVQRMRTGDNAENLAPGFLAAVERRYAGKRLGRQELDGELIEDRPDALWNRAGLEAAQIMDVPELRRIVVAVDPPASARRTSDACGIVAAGLAADGAVIVLADASMNAAQPEAWARTAVRLYHRLQADVVVAEVNQGGDMVSAVLKNADASVPVKALRASRGKWIRAEPVSMLYGAGKVKHAGRFPQLEDEMCDFGPNGLSDGRSPDRLDALVWAVTELTASGRAEPRVRSVQ